MTTKMSTEHHVFSRQIFEKFVKTTGVIQFHDEDDEDDDDDDEDDDEDDDDEDAWMGSYVHTWITEENTQAHLHISSTCVHHNAPGLLPPSSVLLRSEKMSNAEMPWGKKHINLVGPKKLHQLLSRKNKQY